VNVALWAVVSMVVTFHPVTRYETMTTEPGFGVAQVTMIFRPLIDAAALITGALGAT
jgi:hypothetical protein